MIQHLDWRIAVIIPCYRVKKHILQVISNIGSEVNIIYVIDDKCPEESGNYVLAQCTDPRVVVRFNNANLGVGGAVLTKEVLKARTKASGAKTPPTSRSPKEGEMNETHRVLAGRRFYEGLSRQ